MIDTVTDNLRRGTVHTIYTPTEEAEICLICPLKECKNSECERFKEEKRNLKGKGGGDETGTLFDDRKGIQGLQEESCGP